MRVSLSPVTYDICVWHRINIDQYKTHRSKHPRLLYKLNITRRNQSSSYLSKGKRWKKVRNQSVFLFHGYIPVIIWVYARNSFMTPKHAMRNQNIPCPAYFINTGVRDFFYSRHAWGFSANIIFPVHCTYFCRR